MNKVLYTLLMLVSSIFVTRYLGTKYTGQYNYITSISYLLTIVLQLGIYQSVPFNKRAGMPNIRSNYINIYAVQFILMLTISGLVGIVFKDMIVFLASLLTVFDILYRQLNLLIVVEDIRARNRSQTICAFINVIITLPLLFIMEKNLAFAMIILILTKAAFSIMFLICLRTVPNPTQVKWKDITTKIAFGFLPMLSLLLMTFNYRIDIIMLESSVDAKQLSYYSLGVTIAQFAWFIPEVFKEVMFSRTARSDSFDEICATLRISNSVIVLVILGITVLGQWMIKTFFGAEFLPSYSVTLLLFLGIPAMSWFQIIYTLFNAKGKTRISFLVLLLSAITNVILNLIFIPIYGIYGAAGASIVSYFICGMIYLYLFSKMSSVKMYHLFIPGLSDFKLLIKNQPKEG